MSMSTARLFRSIVRGTLLRGFGAERCCLRVQCFPFFVLSRM